MPAWPPRRPAVRPSGRPDEGTPEEVAALLLAEEAEAPPTRSCCRSRRSGRSRPSEVVRSRRGPAGRPRIGRGRRGDAAGGPDGSGGDADGQTAAEESPVDALFAKIRAAQRRIGDGRTGAESAPADPTMPVRRRPPTPRPKWTTDDPVNPQVRRLPGTRTIRTTPGGPQPARRPPRRAHRPDRDLVGPTAEADPPGQPERTARQPAVEGLALVDRAAPRRDRARRRLRHRGPARPGAGGGGRRRRSPAPRRPRGPGPTCWWGSPTIWPRRWSVRCVAGSRTRRPGLADADEAVVAEHVGSAFREWKGERIERLAGDHVVAAFSAGTMSAVGDAQLEWVAVAGSGDAPCPDCEDNGLSGPQQPGQEFPTGHLHPPAHPGCRCLLTRSAT